MKRVLLLLLVLSVLGCRESPKVEESQKGPIPVEAVAAKRVQVEDWAEAVGTVMPWRAVRLTSKVPGRIEAIYAEAGEWVKAGEPLVKLEQRDFLLALERAEAAQRTAEAQLERAEVALEDARRDYERGKALYERRVISQQEYEKLEAAYRSARAQYELARAQLAQAQVVVEQARTELEETVIRAPFSGYVSERFVDPGQRVYTMPPTEILEILDLSQVKVLFDLPERELPGVRKGLRALVSPDAMPDRILEAKVSEVFPKVDPVTRTFRAEVALENPQGLLKAGMFVRVRVLKGKREVVAVPLDALLRAEGTGRVFCFVVEAGRAQRREIVPGARFGGWVEVVEGLREGEMVVVSGKERLMGGEAVEVMR